MNSFENEKTSSSGLFLSCVTVGGLTTEKKFSWYSLPLGESFNFPSKKQYLKESQQDSLSRERESLSLGWTLLLCPWWNHVIEKLNGLRCYETGSSATISIDQKLHTNQWEWDKPLDAITELGSVLLAWESMVVEIDLCLKWYFNLNIKEMYFSMLRIRTTNWALLHFRLTNIFFLV